MTDKSEKSKFGLKKTLFIATVIIGGFFLLLFASYIPAWIVSGSVGNNNYLITISGLDSVKANGETTIMIPLPVYIDGESVFTENMQINIFYDKSDPSLTDNDWNISVKNTAYGEMMVLRTSKSELSDLDISIAEFDRKFIPRLFMPVINIPGDLTPEEFTKKEYGTYESCISINGNFSPFDEPIKFNLQYVGGGNKEFIFIEPIWKSSIRKSVSFENIGYSNASVNYLISDSWD